MKNNISFYDLSFLRRVKWCVGVSRLSFRRRFRRVPAPRYDIIVTTYIARFDSYFKGILFQLQYMFPDRRVFVVVNGYYDALKQEEYLVQLRAYAARYPNVTLVCCDEPVGLSTMWNRALAATNEERVLVLNDDIYLMACFRTQLENSKLLDCPVAVINGSWSHFLITRNLMSRIGGFDEGLREIGYEDTDYMVRLACEGVELHCVSLNGVLNCVEQPDEYSYAEELEISDGKYSSYNERYLHEKWDISEVQRSGSTWVPRLEKWVCLNERSGLASMSVDSKVIS